jgi:hypothetical protein
MPGRLLAYGGTSFSERRRIGQWPAVPEATLRDSYGLQTNAWVYGLGVLARQPFLIFRQRQNIESRGGYPFSLLLDPAEAVWRNFSWNAAALIAALLELNPDLLFKTPESCSADALEALLGGLTASEPVASESSLSQLIAATVTASDPIALSPPSVGFAERPDAASVAASLAALPVCFRASGGWLVGGGSAHGRALGAALVLDDQATADPQPHIEAGRKLTAAWGLARRRGLLEALDVQPLWLWEDNPAATLQAAMLLYDLESAGSISDELIERAENVQALNDPIEQLLSERLTRGSAPLGPKASTMLIARCLKAKYKIDEQTAARLDRETVMAELRRWGSPPKKIPRSLPVPQEWRVAMWVDYLQRLTADVRKNLADAVEQLGPRQELIDAALTALPGSEERLADWTRFREDSDVWPLLQPTLRDEALRRFQRNVKGAEDAYLQIADDPEGEYARSRLPLAEFYRLMPDRRPAAPAARKIELPPRKDLRDEVDALLFNTDRDEVERKAETLRLKHEKVPAAAKTALDAMIETRCDTRSEQFARAYSGKYLALGDVMNFLTDSSQHRLLECLREFQGAKFPTQAGLDIAHALKNKISRNAYSAALSRFLLDDTALRKLVAMRMVEDPRDLERKLKSMLSQKDGRG